MIDESPAQPGAVAGTGVGRGAGPRFDPDMRGAVVNCLA